MNDSHPVRILNRVGRFCYPTKRVLVGGRGLVSQVVALHEIHHQKVSSIGQHAHSVNGDNARVP